MSPLIQRLLKNPLRLQILGLAGLIMAARPGNAVELPPLWRWSNPLPHGATLVDQAVLGAQTVQVGECGQVFASEDWATWSPHDTGVEVALRGVVFFGGRLVVTGEAGTVLYADDPARFHRVDLGTPDWLEGVATSGDLLVAVGDQAAVYISTNAVVWQRVTVPLSRWLRSVTHGNGTFVAVGEGGSILTSTSGLTWRERSSGTTAHLNRVAWLGDRFLAVGEGGVALTSANGTAWSSVNLGTPQPLFALAGNRDSRLAAGERVARLSENQGPWRDQMAPALPAPLPLWTYDSALWSEGDFLLAGRTGLIVQGSKTNPAAPATTWTPVADSVRSWLWSVMRTPTHYVAAGDHGTILTSPNGVDWDLELVPDSATNQVLLGIGGSSNLWLAVGSRGTVLWATNVFLWNPLPKPPTTHDLQGVCFTGSSYLLCGGQGTLLASPDGLQNWTPRSTPTTAFLMSLEVWPGGLVAVGEDGVILTSSGGEVWTRESSGTTNWLSQVRYRGGRLVAVGEQGTILTSRDGRVWERRLSGTRAWLNAVEFLEDTWLVVGNQGTCLASTNALDWFPLRRLTPQSLYGLALFQSQLVAVGTEGVILRSQLVPDPTPIRIAQFAQVSGNHLFLFTGAPGQRFVLESSPDLIGWVAGPRFEFLDGSGTLLHLEPIPPEAPPRTFFRTRQEGSR